MKRIVIFSAVLICACAAMMIATGCNKSDNVEYWRNKLKKQSPENVELDYRLNLAYALDEEGKKLVDTGKNLESNGKRKEADDKYRQANQFFQEAVGEYDKILAKNNAKFRYKAMNNKAETLYNMQKYEDALAVFLVLVKEQPDNTLLHNNVAHCYHGLKQYTQALAEYNEALRLAPDNKQAQIGLGYLKQDMQNAAKSAPKGAAGDQPAGAATSTEAATSTAIEEKQPVGAEKSKAPASKQR